MLVNLGTVLLQLQQYPEAQKYLFKALDKSKAIHFQANEALVLWSLAELHQKLGQLESNEILYRGTSDRHRTEHASTARLSGTSGTNISFYIGKQVLENHSTKVYRWI
jgi:hypothetical protein